METDFNEISARLNTIRYQLMRKKNVVATGIGYKTVAGRATSDLSIICSVEVKKPIVGLHKDDFIPSFIMDIPTDVNATGLIRSFQAPTERFRLAPGGCSIGHYRITAGTLGCLVKKDDVLYILSNNHVLANSNDAVIGDLILQPGVYDGGTDPNDRLAELSDFVPISFEEANGRSSCSITRMVTNCLNTMSRLMGSHTRLRAYRIQQTDNKTDCAIARPFDAADMTNSILQIGVINGLQEGVLGMNVIKSGRTTGLTTGTLQQVDVTARVSYGTNKTALFTDQLMAGAMSQGGDSGSAVLDENNNLVGLLFAGSDSTTLINRISNVFSALGVTLP